MIAQHDLPDGGGLDRAEQDSRRLDVIGLEAEIDNLADGGIAHQFVGHLHGDLHRPLCRGLVTRAVVVIPLPVPLFPFPVGDESDPLGAVGGGAADGADEIGGLNVADRRYDLGFPDFRWRFR